METPRKLREKYLLGKFGGAQLQQRDVTSPSNDNLSKTKRKGPLLVWVSVMSNDETSYLQQIKILMHYVYMSPLLYI